MMFKRRQIMFLFIFTLVFANTFIAFGRVVDEVGKPFNLSDIEEYFPLTPEAREKLFEEGFVVLADVKTDNLAAGYYSLQMKDQICVFLTTDAILSVLYTLQENFLKSTEKDYLYGILEELCAHMQSKCVELIERGIAKEPLIKSALEENVIFFTVACRLLEKTTAVPEGLEKRVEEIVKKIDEHKATEDYPGEDYTQYKVRGYYLGDPELERYFRCMKWLSRKIFHVVNPQKDRRLDRELVQAIIIARILKDNPQIEKEWRRIHEVITMFINSPDSITPSMVQKAVGSVLGRKFDLNILAKPENLDNLRKEFKKSKYPESKIVPLLTWPEDLPMLKKYIQFMGERYVPDSEVFCETSYPYVKRRYLPKGLDVMATILSSERAKEHLSLEIKKYRKLEKKLVKMKDEFSRYSEDDWHKSIYNNWLYCLKPLLKKFDSRYPLFMQSKTWQDEKLNTALSSWAQLRHLYILYAKPAYTVRSITRGGGYVEPIPEFYKEVAGLLQRMQTTFSEREMFPAEYRYLFKDTINGLNRFTRYAQKELDGKSLSDYEKNDIHHFGSWLMRFDLKDPLMIADVCTDSYKQRVLHAGTGYYNPIIVIFKDDEGNSRAAIGYVMSYYELVEDSIKRLDDSQWKKKLEEDIEHLRPKWTKSFLFSSGVKRPKEESQRRDEKSRLRESRRTRETESLLDLEAMSFEEKSKMFEKIKKKIKKEQEVRRKRHEEKIKEKRERLKQEKMRAVTDPEKIAEIILELSTEYRWLRDFNAAMQGYKEVISISPEGEAAKKTLLEIPKLLEEVYIHKKTLEHLPDEIQIRDMYAMGHYGDIEVNEKDIVKAYMDIVEKYLHDKYAVEALEELGNFYYLQEQLEKALPYYKRLIRDFPTGYFDVHSKKDKIINIYSELITNYYWEKKYEEGLNLYEDFLSFAPYFEICSTGRTWYRPYGVVPSLNKEAEIKAQFIRDGFISDDKKPLSLLTDAENRIYFEDYRGAITILDKIIQLYPNWKLINSARVLKGWCYSQLERMEEVFKLEDIIGEELPEYMRQKLFLTLGSGYRYHKNFYKAASVYQKALEIADTALDNREEVLPLIRELRTQTNEKIDLPPFIYDIDFSKKKISWVTDIAATAKIYYGRDGNLNNVFDCEKPTKDKYDKLSHYEVKISCRNPSTTKGKIIYFEPDKNYYFQIVCETPRGTRGKSGVYSLFTDIKCPYINILSPKPDTVLDGETVVEADISDNSGIAWVIFAVEGGEYVGYSYSRKLAHMTEPPYRQKVDLSDIRNGKCDFKVWAKDIHGNVANGHVPSRIMNSTGDVSPPKIKIISPKDGDVVSGIIDIIAEVTDDSKVMSVDYNVKNETYWFLSGNLVNYKTVWKTKWHPLRREPGTYQLQVTAEDVCDHIGKSEIITITVE